MKTFTTNKLFKIVDGMKERGVQQFAVSPEGTITIVFNSAAIQRVVMDKIKDKYPSSADDLLRESQKQTVLGHRMDKLFPVFKK